MRTHFGGNIVVAEVVVHIDPVVLDSIIVVALGSSKPYPRELMRERRGGRKRHVDSAGVPTVVVVFDETRR